MKWATKARFKYAGPTILSIAAAVGVVGTGIAAAWGATKAAKEKDEKRVWRYYIPTAGIGAGTIVCIICANTLSVRQQKSLIGAYALLDQTYREYQQKVKELYGAEAHNQVIDAVVKEHCDVPRITAEYAGWPYSLDPGELENPEIVRTFYEAHSQRYFESTLSAVIQAEYHLNRNFAIGSCISLNDFYELLGLERIQIGDALGWSIEDGEMCWIDFEHHVVRLDDGMEVIYLTSVVEPGAF